MNIVVKAINTKKHNFSNWGYLLENMDTLTAVVIDPAWDFEVYEHELMEKKLIIKAVLLTHSHYDHTDLANKFATKYGVKVYISRIEKEAYNFRCNMLEEVEDKQVLNISGISIHCLLTPGHTKGSMCYYIEKSLFTGDTIFYEGCGLIDKNQGSAADLYHSMQFIKGNIKPDVRVFPGHVYDRGVGQYLTDILNDNIYFNIDQIDKFIEFRTRKGQANLWSFK